MFAVTEPAWLTTLRDKARGGWWLLLSLALVAVIYAIAEYQLGVLAWGIVKVTSGIFLGYWADRSLFRGGRPHQLTGTECRNAAWQRRAIVVVGVTIALALTA